MMIKEFRIPLPLTLEEYRVGQLFSIAELSKMETGGGEGVEFVQNEEFRGFPLFNNQYDSGTHTYKIYHLASRMPAFIRLLFDKDSMDIHEEAWNAFPYCKTIISNPGYMKESFSLVIETIHEEGIGDNENVHMLPPDLLEKREVVKIDIGNDPYPKNDYRPDIDPATFVSEKTNRGPLKEDWAENCQPIMMCYKLVKVEFKWFGLQRRIENYILDTEYNIFLRFHRQMFCWIDRWHGLTMNDIEAIEKETKTNLIRQMKTGPRKAEFAFE